MTIILNNLTRIKNKKQKRVGRGYGSGKGGHTTGRGAKGQKIREKVRLGFEGTKVKKSLIKRLPLLRGRGKFKPWGGRLVPLSLNVFEKWPSKTVVSTEALIKKKMIREGEIAKITGNGNIKTAIAVNIAATKSAISKIEAAGGKIVTEGYAKNI